MSTEVVATIAVFGVTNIIAILGAYIKIKVQITRLEVLVNELEKDVNNLGNLYRSVRKGECRE